MVSDAKLGLTVILLLCIMPVAYDLYKRTETFDVAPHMSYIGPKDSAGDVDTTSELEFTTTSGVNNSPSTYFLNGEDGLVMDCSKDITIGTKKVGGSTCTVNAQPSYTDATFPSLSPEQMLECTDNTTILGEKQSKLEEYNQAIDETK